MTNVEANHSSTGMTSGSHLPSFNVTTLRPNWSLVSLTLFNTAAQTWSSLTDKFYLNLSNFLLLGWNRMFDILFVVHSQAVKLGQDGHRLLHIPLSGSEVDNEIIIVQQEVLGKPSKFQQTLNFKVLMIILITLHFNSFPWLDILQTLDLHKPAFWTPSE